MIALPAAAMTERPHLLLERPPPDEPTGGDPLSDLLRAVRLTGSVFFRIDAGSPWEAQVPEGAAVAAAVMPRTQHVISYHVVTRGACWGGLIGGDVARLETGDVLVLPAGDPYFIATTPRVSRPTMQEGLAFLREMAAGRLPFCVREAKGRERLHLICGFLGCDLRPFNPLLTTLPRLWAVRGAYGARGDSLSRLIDLTLAESREARPGGEAVRVRLSELLFVEVVRRHLATAPAGQTGWLAGLRDPVVARALALLHERPAVAWSLPALAKDAGASRSVLAERFTDLVGLPPMHYLARWRIQLAARRLSDGDAKVAAVAREVGYDSEAAFSRAFKRLAGVSPAAWRARAARPRGARPHHASAGVRG
jgi:AraC-like DNA-binding protein